MAKALVFAATLALLIPVLVHGAEPTMQDVLEERLKLMTSVANADAGLPKISSSQLTPVVVEQVEQVESRQGAVVDEEPTNKPQACSCESDKSQAAPINEGAKDEKAQPTKKSKKDKTKKYKIVTITLPDEPEAEPESVVIETNARMVSEPSEIVSAAIDVPKPKQSQEVVTEAPGEPIESEETENVKVDKKGKGKNDKRKEESKLKGSGKREKRETKKGDKGKSSERKSKKSSKGRKGKGKK